MTDQLPKNGISGKASSEVFWLSAVIACVVGLSVGLLIARFTRLNLSATTVNEFLQDNPRILVDLNSDDFLTRETARQEYSDFILKADILGVKEEELETSIIRPANVACKIAVLRPGEKAIFKLANGKERVIEAPWIPISPSYSLQNPFVYAFHKKSKGS